MSIVKNKPKSTLLTAIIYATVVMMLLCVGGLTHHVFAAEGPVNQTVKANGDGTYNVKLSATPKEEPSNNMNKSTEVVLAIDTSKSMSGESLNTVKESTKKIAKTFLNKNIRTQLLAFGTTATDPKELSLDNYATIIDGLTASNGTTWAPALTRASAILDSHQTENKNIVLISNGAPDDYDAALNVVSKAAENGTSVFAIGLWDDVEKLQDMTQKNKIAVDRNNPKKLTEQEISKYFKMSDFYYTADNEKALDSAYDKILDRITKVVTFKRNFEFSYKLPKWTAIKNDKINNSDNLTKVSYDKEEGTINWSVPSNATVNKEYSINFDVYPKQEAYDRAADLKNALTKKDGSENGMVKQGNDYAQKTNEYCSVTYDVITLTIKTVECEQAKQTFEATNMPLELSNVTLTKEWKEHKKQLPHDKIVALFKKDNKTYKTFTLNDENKWNVTNIYAAPGLEAGGKALNKGHTYSIDEEKVPTDYELTVTDPKKPMLRQGKLSDADKAFTMTLTNWHPEVVTNASDSETKDHVGKVDKDATIIDNVSFYNCIPGHKYNLDGKVVDKDTEKTLSIDGNEITVSDVLEPKTHDGQTTMKYKLDSRDLEGKTVVVYETLSFKGDRSEGKNEDPEDIREKAQAIHYPQINQGTAVDNKTGDHVGTVSKDAGINAKVYMSNLLEGSDYTVTGTLVDQKTGKPFTKNGKNITASATFTANKDDKNLSVTKTDDETIDDQISDNAETSDDSQIKEDTFPADHIDHQLDGYVSLNFKFDSSLLEGRTAVVYEDLIHNDVTVTKHHDVNDEELSIHYPKLRTNAIDSKTKDQTGTVEKQGRVIDKVSYWNAIPGQSYTISGVLIDKATGKPIVQNGKQVESIKTITPNEANGTIEMAFDLDTSSLKGKTTVAFENLIHNKVIVTKHANINSEDQSIHYPDITTKADIDGKQSVMASTNSCLTDTVTYKNLIPKQRYSLKGILMDKKTGKPVDVNGKQVTAEQQFIADKADGEVKMQFNFDSTHKGDFTVVVYENLIHNNITVVSHQDINDTNQSVLIKENPQTGVTGDHTTIILIVVLVAAAAAVCVFTIKKKHTTKKDQNSNKDEKNKSETKE